MTAGELIQELQKVDPSISVYMNDKDYMPEGYSKPAGILLSIRRIDSCNPGRIFDTGDGVLLESAIQKMIKEDKEDDIDESESAETIFRDGDPCILLLI